MSRKARIEYYDVPTGREISIQQPHIEERLSLVCPGEYVIAFVTTEAL
jgi:hypothetical protein